MYVSPLREAAWPGREGEVEGTVVFSRCGVDVAEGACGGLHVVEGVGG